MVAGRGKGRIYEVVESFTSFEEAVQYFNKDWRIKNGFLVGNATSNVKYV